MTAAYDSRARMILILGGTGEARALAEALQRRGVAVASSLAGRVARPRLPPGEVRIGGFGGPDGLASWLRERRVRAVIDATHPFAQRISASAVSACQATGVPLLRLERAPWRRHPDDRWSFAADLAQAAALVGQRARAAGASAREPLRVLLTTGRQGLHVFAPLDECWFLIRCVQEPSPPLPPRHRLLVDRGPFTLDSELALIGEHRIQLLVAKESGGAMTQAKLDAARARGLEVILVRRPPRAPAPTVSEVEQALAWACAAAGMSP